MLKIFALFAVTLAKVDHHETQEFWVYPGGEEHTHVGEKVTKEVFSQFQEQVLLKEIVMKNHQDFKR